jgi:branched-chain amino acid transport system substrate-binding protein
LGSKRSLARRSLVLALTVVVALLAVAAAQSRSRAGSTIDIGGVFDKSGATVASQAPLLHALQSYLRMVNDAGGVNGKKINLIEKDDSYNPATELPLVKSLINDDKVPVIMGLGTSSGIQSVLPLLAQGNTLGVFMQANIKDMTNPFQKNVFEANCNLSDQADVAVGYMLSKLHKKNLKGMKVGVAAIAVASGQEWTDVSKSRVSALGGTPVVTSLPAAIVNADVQVQDFANQKVDFIMLHHAIGGGIAFLKSLAKYNFTPPVMGAYGVTQEPVWTQAPYDATKNFLGVNCYTPPNILKTAQAKQAIATGKKYGFSDTEINQPNWAQGWVEGMWLVAGLKKVKGDYTADNIRKALESVKLKTGGLSPDISPLGAKCHILVRQIRPYTYSFKTKTLQPVGSYQQWGKYVTNSYAAPGSCGKK